MTLFLPFTPAGKATERAAIKVKKHLGLGPYAQVDPWEVLSAVPARLIELDGFPTNVRRRLTEEGNSEWSAIGYGKSPVDGKDLILLNPGHHEHRQRASLMEEEVHIVLDHPKVRLRFDESGSWRRPFASEVEDEAYNIGAACIIPYKPLFEAVKYDGLPANEIARQYSVSVDYVEFRIKRSGLYRVYRKQCAPHAN